MSSLPARMKIILKNEGATLSVHKISPIMSMEIFPHAKGQLNSPRSDFELVQDFMVVLVTCIKLMKIGSKM